MIASDGGRFGGNWPRGRTIRTLRLGVVLAVLMLVVVTIVVLVQRGGPPTREDLLEQAHLIGKQDLRIGVKNDHPGMALYDPKTRTYSGFDIDIAYMIAGDLGFRPSQVRFLPIETEDRARMQARDADGRFVTVDMVVATFSITEERERLPTVSFSAPYLRTEQTVMTRQDVEPAESMSDFSGMRMCTTATSTSTGPAAEAKVRLVSRNSMKKCADGLLSGEFDAVTSDAAILAGFVKQYPGRLRLHDVGLDTLESYGVNTGGNDALTKLVNLSLYQSRNDPRDRRWEDAFDRNLAAEQQAAGIQQVAISEQPPVEKVEIRQWPWERDRTVGAGTFAAPAAVPVPPAAVTAAGARRGPDGR
ncbi:amino acid ABC transporter substrate-binding protein, PAAT family [Thermomonospora echinospora]|uniref:Amino acid ABC transporter substrate-binding protein, PAAT family n=1 Tax=Thermomonospora echinospora TaxID=1992 RepID=A0A1H6CMT7_9ACTN|nr:transporter substrate-binding domain-containing protein [Thermomonospora echinospora]SEG74240.1 amino acid ABC transporter substrate-binding protein, PAAT family [Thermomonospora echinospora]